jgi:hypothetical protein
VPALTGSVYHLNKDVDHPIYDASAHLPIYGREDLRFATP